jgi:hypothetical protein
MGVSQESGTAYPVNNGIFSSSATFFESIPQPQHSLE